MVVRKILEQTLSAGSSSVVFTDAEIPNSLIRVYSSNADIIPVSRTISGTSLTVTYEPQTSNIDVAVEIVKAGLDIVDNLTSTDTDKALSAKQGKVLKDDLDALSNTVDNLDIPDNITDLDDVDINNLQDGQVLAWDENAEKFVNVNQSGGGENYTSIETKIGKWSDNTDLYMKRIEETVNRNSQYTFNFTDGQLQLVDGYIINSQNNIRVPVKSTWWAGSVITEFLYDESHIYLNTGANLGTTGNTLILFVKYTKNV